MTKYTNIRRKVALAEAALDDLYAIVRKFPESSYKNGQLRYLDNCYRSLRRMRTVVGGRSKLNE